MCRLTFAERNIEAVSLGLLPWEKRTHRENWRKSKMLAATKEGS